jgi:hypothetical protein
MTNAKRRMISHAAFCDSFQLNRFSINGCGKGREAGQFCHLIVELRKPHLDRMAEP